MVNSFFQHLGKKMSGKAIHLLLIPVALLFLSQSSLGTEMELKKGSINGILYMTGGAGKGERADMVKMYRDYNLKIILAMDTGAYLALLPVTIYDSSGNRLLETEASGPWLYVRLPEGKYIVQSSYNGEVKKRNVLVGQGLELVMFNWDA